MSASPKRDEFQQYMETVIERNFKISELTLWDYFKLVGADNDFKTHLQGVASAHEEVPKDYL